MTAKNVKRAPQTGTHTVEGGGAGLGIGKLKREDEGNCSSRVFLACGSVGRKANGKADHDLQLTQDFEQLLTGTPWRRERRQDESTALLFFFFFLNYH